MKLTKRVIDATTHYGKKGTTHYLWDDQLAGFGVVGRPQRSLLGEEVCCHKERS